MNEEKTIILICCFLTKLLPHNKIITREKDMIKCHD